MRVYVAVFNTIWCGVLVSAGVRGAFAGSVATLIIVPMLGLGAASGYRMFRLGVRAEHDNLTVRNNWSTRTLTRADIEGFRTGGLGRGGLPGSQAVQLLLRDATILPLDVTATALPLRRSRARLQERLQKLQAWHNG